MNILVCIKQVADDSVNVSLNSAGFPNLDGIAMVVNAFDTYALEMAVRLKESCGGIVTVLSLGNAGVRESLKNSLAVGGDRAFLICDSAFDNLDTQGIATVLCGAIRKLEQDQGAEFDLILFGKESTDYSSGQIGALVAELLGRGLAVSVTASEPGNGVLTLRKETEDGYCTLSAQLPAVITVGRTLYEPRYATIKSKLAARKAEIPVLSGADFPGLEVPVSGETVMEMREPAKRAAGQIIKEETTEETVSQLLERLREASVL